MSTTSNNAQLEHLKKYHSITNTETLSKLSQFLPKDFHKSFEFNFESVLANSFIIKGVKAGLPETPCKLIGTLTRNQRNEKIAYYKTKRDKRM